MTRLIRKLIPTSRGMSAYWASILSVSVCGFVQVISSPSAASTARTSPITIDKRLVDHRLITMHSCKLVIVAIISPLATLALAQLGIEKSQSRPPGAQEAALCYNSSSLSPGLFRSRCWDCQSGYSAIPFLGVAAAWQGKPASC